MTLVNDVDLRTVPVGAVVEMIRGDGFWWGALMGAALLTSVPVAILYSFFADCFVAGLTAGAVRVRACLQSLSLPDISLTRRIADWVA